MRRDRLEGRDPSMSTVIDSFDKPMDDVERAEIAEMPSHELYLLTKMVPYGTVRAREVNALYHDCIKREIRP